MSAAKHEASTPDSSQSSDATVPLLKPDAESARLPGDRYRVIGEIARGGMGVVLWAHDTAFDRPLAIKLLLDHGDRAEAERRFLAEARITGQLQHPGIPPAHEVGRLPDGRPFFSMKLIKGRTLADLLAERPTPQTDLQRFITIFEHIAQTLAYAHSQAIIHRDLKPLNIMVGAFGEVQVMDWGLAKRLPREDAPDSTSGSARAEVSDLASDAEQTVHADADTEDSRTQAGQVLGTFAYMAPEQARGEVQALDERCDVFGLGAILCRILTGEPPYRGAGTDALRQQARAADLDDAWARLDDCGADPELARLAKDCLAPNPDQRPRHAGQLAEALARHLLSVQERLQQARLARNEAEVKAREEGKRRRLAVGLAAAVVLLLAGAAAAGVWYLRDQGMRQADASARKTYLQREVAAALDEAGRFRADLHARLRDPRQAAQLLSELKEWSRLLDSAHEAWTRADRLAAGDRDMLAPEVAQRLTVLEDDLQADERDRQLAFGLDQVRLEASTLVDVQMSLRRAATKSAKLFADAGFDLEKGDPNHLAARLRDSPIRLPLVAALDFWALATGEPQLRARLLEVARGADPDSWRDRFRQVEAWDELSQLQSLAAQVDFQQQSPQLLVALAQRLRVHGGDAATLLRKALVHHPRDFWLCFELGLASKNAVEQAGAFRAALVARPDSPVAYYSLGVVVAADGKRAESMACYRKAIELDPNHASAHNNLGLAYDELKQPDEALACYRRAVQSEPKNVTALSNLGATLFERGQLDEAIDFLGKAVELDPNNAPAHNNLGSALRGQGKLEEAAKSYRKAIEIQSEHAMAWCNLGHVLTQQGKFSDGLDALKRGHELGSRQKGWPYFSGLWVQNTARLLALDQKLAAVLRGESEPAEARERAAMAELCAAPHKELYVTAARFYAAAFAAEPQLAGANSADHRFNAACAAVLTAAGQGNEASELDKTERDRWRQQALDWLKADLQAWTKRLTDNPKSAANVAKAMKHWQSYAKLAGVRDEATLAAMPAPEQTSWRQLWTEVAALRQRAEAKKQ
jgi:serine/threonine-protein kinase